MAKILSTRTRSCQVLDQAGQSTLEFALTLVLLMGFVLFYLQLTLVFAFGNYVHYATFMAARAYLSASESTDDQEARAKAVIEVTLKERNAPGVDRFPSLGKGIGGDSGGGIDLKPHSQFRENDRNLSWLQGVRYSFRSRLFLLPMGGSKEKLVPGANSVTLTAESWLGKEPTSGECETQMNQRAAAGGAGIVVYDNGC